MISRALAHALDLALPWMWLSKIKSKIMIKSDGSWRVSTFKSARALGAMNLLEKRRQAARAPNASRLHWSRRTLDYAERLECVLAGRSVHKLALRAHDESAKTGSLLPLFSDVPLITDD